MLVFRLQYSNKVLKLFIPSTSMVNTRSQIRDNNTLESTRMSDNENETGFPDVLTRERMIEFDSHDILNRQNNAERNVIDRRFNEMNRQIEELTDLVLALTQQISSNPREGNLLNTVTTNANSRSDSMHPRVCIMGT